MPIKPHLRHCYGPEWKAITARIRERAGNRCERCGVPNGAVIVRTVGGWYMAAPWQRPGATMGNGTKAVREVLTVHHIVAVEDGGGNEDSNLKALCCRCHNLADSEMRQRHAAQTRARKAGERRESAGQGVLW